MHASSCPNAFRRWRAVAAWAVSPRVCRAAVLVLVVVIGGLPVAAQTPASESQLREEVARLRAELEALRAEYGEQLRQLQASLAALQAQGPAPDGAQAIAQAVPVVEPPGQPRPTTAPAPAGAAGSSQGTLPVYGNASVLSKIFNPDLAAIGNFVAVAGRNRVDATPALDLPEVETSLQAIVDPYARGDVFLAFGPEGVEVEEAFVTFPALPGGLSVKAGSMRNAFGKVNTMHTHALPWSDRPLVVRNLVGGEEGISGPAVSASRLVPNPWVFLEFTGEVSSQQSERFSSASRSDLTWIGRLRGYEDLTEASNLDLGASFAYGPDTFEPSASTRLVGMDATFRYRPLRRAIYHRVLARTELVWSRRTDMARTAFGTYAAADYQFARRWFAGVRYDYSQYAFDPELHDRGTSWLLTFWPSEFSQVRTQYRRVRYAGSETSNEVLLQLLFSIGAHGAHTF